MNTLNFNLRAFFVGTMIGTGLVLAAYQSAHSADVPQTHRSPASVPGGKGPDLQEPVEIRGQSRTLSMGLTLQSKKEKLRFVEPRRNYRSEILNTNY